MSKSGGVFQFFGGRMTSRGQCPGGVLVNVQEWGCFSIFWRADDVTRTMSKGVCACECLHPPLQEILYPRLCSTYPSSDPPPTWMAGYGPACDHYCIILLNPTLKQIGFRNVVLCRGGSSSAPTGGGHSRGWWGWVVAL